MRTRRASSSSAAAIWKLVPLWRVRHQQARLGGQLRSTVQQSCEVVSRSLGVPTRHFTVPGVGDGRWLGRCGVSRAVAAVCLPGIGRGPRTRQASGTALADVTAGPLCPKTGRDERRHYWPNPAQTRSPRRVVCRRHPQHRSCPARSPSRAGVLLDQGSGSMPSCRVSRRWSRRERSLTSSPLMVGNWATTSSARVRSLRLVSCERHRSTRKACSALTP